VYLLPEIVDLKYSRAFLITTKHLKVGSYANPKRKKRKLPTIL